MVEKTYHDIAPYLNTFGAFLMHPYMVQIVFPNTKMIVGMWRSTHVIFHLVKKPFFWSKTTLKDYMVEKTYHLAQYLGPFRVAERGGMVYKNPNNTQMTRYYESRG